MAANLYDQEVAADNPAGYWKLDETSGTVAMDSSAYDNDGTINGGVTVGQSGGPITSDANCYLFDGTSGYIQIPDSNVYDVGSAPLSAECWVNANNLTGFRMPFTKDVSNGGSSLQFELQTAGTSLRSMSAGGFVEQSATISTGTWFHIVLAQTSTGSNLYLNGVLAASSGSASNYTANTRPLYIGGRDDLSFWWSGYISHVAFYQSALSPSRVLAHYNAATSRVFTPPVLDYTPPIPVADHLHGPPIERSNPLGWALMRHYQSRAQGQTVFKMSDGTYQRIDINEPYPATDQVVNNAISMSYYDGHLTADLVTNPVVQVYYGGHSYSVSSAEAAALTAAGYGANIT